MVNLTETDPFQYQCSNMEDILVRNSAHLTSTVLASLVAAAVLNGLMSVVITAANAVVVYCILAYNYFREKTFPLLLASMSMTGKKCPTCSPLEEHPLYLDEKDDRHTF